MIKQSQNILLQLARETDNIDLLELKDDLAYNLQLCDQLTYDVSIYRGTMDVKARVSFALCLTFSFLARRTPLYISNQAMEK